MSLPAYDQVPYSPIVYTAPADSAPEGAAKLDAEIAFLYAQIGTRAIALSTYTNGTFTVDSTGLIDSTAAVQAALNVAASLGLWVIWDCPIFLQCGNDYTKGIFVPNFSKVIFVGAGVCITDGVGVHTFNFINVHDWRWENTQVKYIAGTAPSAITAFGVFGIQYQSTTFGTNLNHVNDITITNYLVSSGANTFSGGAIAQGGGPTNGCAIFNISGNCYSGSFTGKSAAYVPAGAAACAFIPVLFALGPNWNQGLAVSGATVAGPATMKVPHDISWEDWTLDGTLMGWVGGGGYNLHFKNIIGIRYSDLQDASGGNIGGVAYLGGPWFAPPHLIYMDSGAYAGGNFPSSFDIANVYDEGQYVGASGRRSPSSGYMHSLKCDMGNGSSINNYTSLRPDGLWQCLGRGYPGGRATGMFGQGDTTLASNLLTISGVGAGVCLNNVFIEAKLIDTAPIPAAFPMGSDVTVGNSNLHIDVETFSLDYPVGATWQPGFGVAGDGNFVRARIILDACNSAQTSTGALLNSGAAYSTNSSFDYEIVGWRILTGTLSGGLSIGATSATLDSTVYPTGWNYPNGTYLMRFSDNEERAVSFTNSSNSISWTGGLTAAVTTKATIKGLTSANFDTYKQRITVQGAGQVQNVYGNRVRVADISNGWESIGGTQGLAFETWAQQQVCIPPSGASFSTYITYPSSFAIDQAAAKTTQTYGAGGSIGTIGLGWSGSATSLLPAISHSNGGSPETPYAGPVTGSGGNTLLLTPNSGTFDGTAGITLVAVRASRTVIGG